ncbi:hypothetical protein GPECTOR_92g592 [Gonium pectorale]|uniref:Uncharacterized protein n=1 Tax=Gonium pectorale TaxID=33097 RepID=A0A150G0J1_GONPE|nr:hypothetical protein GPECTOR_92g592 [Gonium pectorale]|eukprot:KXZ43369.1 hypothetical protein GPECTOR_92g592 [Gonium pectorale]
MARTKSEARKSDGQGAARRGPSGVKAKPEKAAPKDASFVVSSLQEWQPDGWHSYQGPGTRETDSVHKTLKAANKRARELFFKENPWGLGADEIENEDVEEEVDEFGCVTLTVCPPDSEMWEVQVEMVASKKKK